MLRGISIRRLEIRDLSGIAGLRNLVCEGGMAGQFLWNVEHIASLLTTDMSLSFVALQGKKLIGFLIASAENNYDSPSVGIACLAVAPGLNGRGIEEKLLDGLKNEMIHRHIYSAGVELPEDNIDMIAIFNKYGYTAENRHIRMRYQVHEIREERK
ncbi:MAG: hypothetical protein CVV44_11715 [Spirochaetae bacterium HGW-Spirochaetae-1]|jgi:ribosomal protein S18 acetylase RimI-like enzyme|nr:MAG: hypothetical protein CVV44_11715 [Spirochaetae bacterium HGW-Spirochaetae-1]